MQVILQLSDENKVSTCFCFCNEYIVNNTVDNDIDANDNEDNCDDNDGNYNKSNDDDKGDDNNNNNGGDTDDDVMILIMSLFLFYGCIYSHSPVVISEE